MDVMQFTQAVSRIWVLETRLLDKSKIERMVDAETADEVLKILDETEYSNIMGNIKRASDYEEILSTELKRVYKLVYDICPIKEVVDLMSIKYQYHNLKVLVKEKILNKDFSDMLIELGSDDLNEVRRKINTDNFKSLKAPVQKAVEAALNDYELTKDPQRIDLIIDNHMFMALEKIKKDLNYGFVDKIVNSLIDLTNVRTLLRVKKQDKGRDFASEVLVDGGTIPKTKLLSLLNETSENIMSKLSQSNYSSMIKEGMEAYIETGSTSTLEKLADNQTMKLMKDAKFVTFGPERILAYIYAKETEIKLIRVIMVGKLNNIAEEVIRERLRDVYV